MARSHYVKRARKAVPAAGIEVGDSYYWWKFRHGGKHYSKTPPRQSQLTNSEKMSRAYAAAEDLSDYSSAITDSDDTSDIESRLEEIASEIRDIAQEYRDAVDNMPENLQSSPTADECNEKADALESWADDVESAIQSCDDKPEEPDEPEPLDDDASDEEREEQEAEYQEAKADYDDALNRWHESVCEAVANVADCPI